MYRSALTDRMMSRFNPSTASNRRGVRAVPLIAHVVHRFDTGGMENGIANLLNHLPKDRYSHAVVCLTNSTDFAKRLGSDNVAIHALHKKPGKDAGVYPRFWRLLRALRPAIVHTRNIGTLDLAPLAALAGVPVRIHGEHGWDASDAGGQSRKYRRLRRCCDPMVTQYVAVSQDIERWLTTYIGIRRAKVRHLCNGVDTDLFRPDGPAATLFGRERNADDDTVTIGTVGRMDPIKALNVLIAAVAQLVSDNPRSRRRLRLVIVGDGPTYTAVSEQVREAALDDIVFLAGHRKDIPEVLRSLDLFVLPSQNEGISNTVLEAMATGLPVVGTNVGGNPELIQDARTGYLVPPNSPGELAAAIRRYVDDAGLRRDHGRAARRRAQELFSLKHMVAEYDQMYDCYLLQNQLSE